jgi:PAS domain S-box-containing protein
VLRSLAPRAAAEIERGQRALALQRSASRLRLLAERSKDVLFFYRLTPYPSMEFLSPAVESVFGYPVEAFHANPELLLQLVDDEDRPRLYEALSSGSEVPLITRVHRPDGGRRWVEYRDFPVRDREDHLIGIGGTIRDISASVEAEQSARESAEYVRALLDSIPDTLMLLHPDGTIRDYVIGEVELVEGPRSEVIGRQLREVVSMAAFAVLDRSVRAAVRTKRPQRMEFEMPGNDRRFLEVRSLPFVRGEVLLVLRDLTAKKWHETEEERHRLRDELDQRIERTTKTNPYALTYREMAVLHLVVEGMADKQIAEALGISIYTVNKHVGNILSKMNASSRTEASVRAVKEGFLRSDGESF